MFDRTFTLTAALPRRDCAASLQTSRFERVCCRKLFGWHFSQPSNPHTVILPKELSAPSILGCCFSYPLPWPAAFDRLRHREAKQRLLSLSKQSKGRKHHGAPKKAPQVALVGAKDALYDKPAQFYDKPAQFYDKPAQSCDKPAQSRGKPAQSRGKPAQSCDKPAQSHDKPAQSCGKWWYF
ncbi:MAG: hypothetical protein LBS64_02410 [Spirochaetaceae bacterium]|jgi:hypothetical protein|nr:hypothetical protein [Spirochaetaceae bacterium]